MFYDFFFLYIWGDRNTKFIEMPSSVVKDKCDFHIDFHLVLFSAFKNEMGLEPMKIFFRETFFHEKANYRKFSQKKSNEAIWSIHLIQNKINHI